MPCREAAAIRERYPSRGKVAKLAIEQEIGGRSKGYYERVEWASDTTQNKN
jgi:hypothetical protein